MSKPGGSSIELPPVFFNVDSAAKGGFAEKKMEITATTAKNERLVFADSMDAIIGVTKVKPRDFPLVVAVHQTELAESARKNFERVLSRGFAVGQLGENASFIVSVHDGQKCAEQPSKERGLWEEVVANPWNTAAVSELLRNGADPNEIRGGKTVICAMFDASVECGHRISSTLNVLLDYGANPLLGDENSLVSTILAKISKEKKNPGGAKKARFFARTILKKRPLLENELGPAFLKEIPVFDKCSSPETFVEDIIFERNAKHKNTVPHDRLGVKAQKHFTKKEHVGHYKDYVHDFSEWKEGHCVHVPVPEGTIPGAFANVVDNKCRRLLYKNKTGKAPAIEINPFRPRVEILRRGKKTFVMVAKVRRDLDDPEDPRAVLK